MKNNQEIVDYLNRLQQEITSLHHTLEKYRQDTEYCCLKLGINDWVHFLTDIRVGNILYMGKNYMQSEAVKQQKMSKASDEINYNKSSFKTVRKHNQEYQSPICSEARIARIKGDESERSQSTHSQINQEFIYLAQPFKKNNQIHHQGSIPEAQTVQSILKYIEDYQSQKLKETEGFDTFRKITNNKEENVSKRNRSNNTIKKQQTRSQSSEHSYESLATIESLRQSQHVLALQNTKLRRQIRQKDELLKKYTITLIL